MGPLLLTVLVVAGGTLVVQLLAGSDRALRVRRWTPWLLVPLAVVILLETRAAGVTTLELWAQRLALGIFVDWFVSDLRRAWRARRHRASVA
jgi:hypothetical protein